MDTFNFTAEEKEALYKFVVGLEQYILNTYKDCRLGFSIDLEVPNAVGEGASYRVRMGGRLDEGKIYYTSGLRCSVTYTNRPTCADHSTYKRLSAEYPYVNYAIFRNKHKIRRHFVELMNAHKRTVDSLAELMAEQNPIKEVTMSELESTFGRKVKIVGDGLSE
jgi:hypothetical protein